MKTALCIYADGSEDLEITAPRDILVRGGIKVTAAAVTPDNRREVTLSQGTVIRCDLHVNDCRDGYDAIIVPGGMPGSEHCRDCAALVKLLQQQRRAGRIIGAICAAPGFVLATHGIITDERATGYPGTETGIRHYTGAGVERDGTVITAKGPGFAAAFGLELLRALTDAATAAQVAAGMLLPTP